MKDFDKYEAKGAYHFDWYNDPNWVWYKECVDRCVEFCKGPTIDVGCGDGLVLSKLPEGSLGIDDSKHGLMLVDDTKYDVRYGDINTSRLLSTWDYMVCLNVIEHLKSPKPIIDILRDNVSKGAIIITDKATDEPGRYHEHEYTKKELLDTFKEFKPKYFEINSTEFGKPITFIGVEILK